MFISAMRRPRHVDGFGVKTAETKTFTGGREPQARQLVRFAVGLAYL